MNRGRVESHGSNPVLGLQLNTVNTWRSRLTGETSLATVYRLETIGNPRLTTSAPQWIGSKPKSVPSPGFPHAWSPLWIGSKPQRPTSHSASHRLAAHRFSNEYSEYGPGEARFSELSATDRKTARFSNEELVVILHWCGVDFLQSFLDHIPYEALLLVNGHIEIFIT